MCFNLPPKSSSSSNSGSSCETNSNENGKAPDNYTIGSGENLGVKVNANGSFCINVGPSVGLPGGVGWNL